MEEELLSIELKDPELQPLSPEYVIQRAQALENDVEMYRRGRNKWHKNYLKKVGKSKLYREFFSLTKDKINTDIENQDEFIRIMDLIELLRH